ncbi:MAG: GNAT family N-acetyltransferase [Flavobacteriaceae bacterium]
MKNYPSLTTSRLLLDQIKISDITDIVTYANNKKIVMHTRTMPHPYHEEDAIAWINMANQGFKSKDSYIFAMRDKSSSAFLGGIGLTLDSPNNRAELGYWIAEKFWNQGYTTEAVTAILKFGFEALLLNKIVAVYIDTNTASGKIMEKNGMMKEAVLKDHDLKDGVYKTLIQYRMLRSEYESLKN